MKKYVKTANYGSVHFIGAGGVSMSALAKYALLNGKKVSGSDKSENGQTLALKKLGAEIYIGHDEKNLKDCDIVVYSSAVGEENAEIKEAKRRGIPLFKRSEFLAAAIGGYPHSVCVAGSHGKTTATAMLAHIFYEANKNPAAFIGGEDAVFGNFLYGEGDYVIAEACEYKKNFLDLKPSVAVILNIDNDHLESYGSMENMTEAFSEFSRESVLVINADDEYCQKIYNPYSATFGVKNSASYRAENLKKKDGAYSFTAYSYGVKRGRINLKVYGLFNVYNALAAFAVADICKIPFCNVKTALENFTPVKRRTEFLGEFCGKNFYADYAHHPKEIKETLKVFPKDSLIIFQPHTYSRTRLLMDDFVDAFKDRAVIIYKTYPAREIFDKSGDGKTLYNNLLSKSRVKPEYAKSLLELKELILKSRFKTAVFLGAGDIYDLAKKILL